MKNKGIIITSLIILAVGSMAMKPKGNPLRTFFENTKTFYKKVRFETADKFVYKKQLKKGFAKKSDFKKPENIGLVCFMVKDQAVTTYGRSGMFSTEVKTWGSNKKVKAITQQLYNESIEELKSSFKKMGYNLQEPKEFCTTPKQMDVYKNYKIHYNVGEKLASKAYLMNTKNGYFAVPAGYRPVPIGGMTGAGYMKAKIKNRPYHYMQALGLDALLFIYVQESSASGKLNLARAIIHVKTPGYNEKGKTGFTDFANKFKVELNLKEGMKDIFTYKMIEGKKGKKKKSKDITGLDPVFKDIVVRLSTDAAREMTKWYDKLK